MPTYTYIDAGSTVIEVNDGGAIQYVPVDAENTEYAAILASGDPIIPYAAGPSPPVATVTTGARSPVVPSATTLLEGEEGLAVDGISRTAVKNDYAAAPNADARIESVLTVARASTSSARARSRLLAHASSNVLAYHHDEAGLPRGIRVMPATENKLLRSQEVDNASWTKTALLAFGSGSVANHGVAPDGTTTSELIVPNTTNTFHSISQASIAADTAVAITFSMWVKAAGYTRVQVRLTSDAGPIVRGDWDLVAGTATANFSGGATSAVAWLAENWGNGWYRLSVTGVLASGSTVTARLYVLDATGATNYAGDGTSGMEVWGGQLEETGWPTPYIVTTSAAVTRNADSATIATSALAWSAIQGSVAIRARTARTDAIQVLWQVDDGSENNRFRVVRDGSGIVRCIVTTGGSEVCNLNLGTVAVETDFALAFGWRAGDFAASLNGAEVVTDSAGALPSVSTMRFGSSFTGEHWCSTIARVMYASRRMSNTDLIRLAG